MISKKFGAFIFICIAVVFAGYICRKVQNFLPTSAKTISDKTVIIDAGHGFPDGGAQSESGIKESEINLKIAIKLKKLLKKAGVKVIMTRENENSLSKLKSGNKTDDMKKRVSVRDDSKGDIFISIHLNHFSQSQYHGAQVFYNTSPDENSTLAQCIQDSLISIADPDNTRNIKSDDTLFILKNSSIPAVLVECGFLSNDEESQKLNTEEYQKTLSNAIYLGICKYFASHP